MSGEAIGNSGQRDHRKLAVEQSSYNDQSIMEATPMKLVGIISTAVLSLTLAAPRVRTAGAARAGRTERQACPEKRRKRNRRSQQSKRKRRQPEKTQAGEERQAEEKNAKQEQQRTPEAKPEKQEQHAGGGRIPDDRYKANFGREHSFRVSQGDYRNHRFQYGGYWFGFVDAWPSNWLYTQDVYVSTLTACITCATRCIRALTLHSASRSSGRPESA